MFILEGIPSVLLGIVVLRFLTDRPSQATWLTQEQREWLANEMDAERAAAAQTTGAHDHGLGEVLRSLLSWNVLRLALVYFGLTTGLYGIELWLPQIVKCFGLSNVEVGLVAAIPYAAAIATMMLWASYSDRSGQRLNHVALAAGMGCVGMGARRGRRRASGVDHGLPLHRYRRRHGRPPALLDPADRVPVRPQGGCRHRRDQLDRQSRRVLRPDPDRLRPGDDRAASRSG